MLEVRPVGIREDFFALGGHSLLAVRLLARVRQRFGRELPLASLFQGATVERMARWLRDEAAPRDTEVLVTLQDAAGRPPLFCVHPIGGGVLCYAELAALLGPEQPFYGLQAVPTGPAVALEAMAARYLEAIRERQPRGPYHLAGWSMGGVVAYEMALQLRREGHEVAFLGLVDAAAPAGAAASLDEPDLLLAFAADLAALAGASEDDRTDRLEIEGGASLKQLLSAHRHLLPPDLKLADVRRLYETFRANALALSGYRPQPYAGRLTLFRATDRDGCRPEDLGWRSLAAEVTVEPLPGDHFGLLRGHGARALATALRAALAAVVTPPAGS